MGTIHRFKGTNGNWVWEGVPLKDYGASRPGVTVHGRGAIKRTLERLR